MFNKLKQFKDLRDQAKDLQSKLAEETVDVTELMGKIKLTMDGNQKVQSLSVDESLLNTNDKNRLEKGLTDAFNSAIEKVQKKMAVKMREMGGLDMFKNLQ